VKLCEFVGQSHQPGLLFALTETLLCGYNSKTRGKDYTKGHIANIIEMVQL